MNNIASICEQYGVTPRTLVECGAGHPTQVRLWPYIESGANVILVEANPRLAYCLQHGYPGDSFESSWPKVPPPPYNNPGLTNYPNVTVVNAAITDEQKTVDFYEFHSSSFVSGITSPAKINDGFQEHEHTPYPVDGIPMSDIDDGTIDVLLCDVEGSEWFCLTTLKSRPAIIILELYGFNYLNPYYDEIKDWMDKNGYTFVDRDHSDALFVKTT